MLHPKCLIINDVASVAPFSAKGGGHSVFQSSRNAFNRATNEKPSDHTVGRRRRIPFPFLRYSACSAGNSKTIKDALQRALQIAPSPGI
jgi:hypothetical protein